MSRPSTRRPDDETGTRLLDAGVRLLEDGTPLDELRLTDAVDRASQDGKGPLTTGSAYPRFRGGQSEFRLAVLAHALEKDHARHRADGLDLFADNLRDQVRPVDIPSLVEVLAGSQEERVRADPGLPLRLYATYRSTEPNDERTTEIRTRLRERDERMNSNWTKAVAELAEELNVQPRKDFEFSHFEIFLTSLLNGLAIRNRTSDVPEGLYAKFVQAAALGFFEPKSQRRSLISNVLSRYLQHAMRGRPRPTKQRILAAARQLSDTR